MIKVTLKVLQNFRICYDQGEHLKVKRKKEKLIQMDM